MFSVGYSEKWANINILFKPVKTDISCIIVQKVTEKGDKELHVTLTMHVQNILKTEEHIRIKDKENPAFGSYKQNRF